MFMKTSRLCREYGFEKTKMLEIIHSMHQNVKYGPYVIPPKRRGQPWRVMPEAVERWLRYE